MIARPVLSTNDTAAQHDVPGGPPWHTVEPDAVAIRLETSPHGLSQDEARCRLDRDGPNQLAETPPTSPLLILLHQFRSPLIYILLAATLVTLLLEEFIDAGVIAAVLALNAIIGFTQERKAERSVRALMRLMAPKAHVVRGGREWSIESRDLVAGDDLAVGPQRLHHPELVFRRDTREDGDGPYPMAPHWDAAKSCTRATLGDMGITLVAFWGTAAAARSRDWIRHPRRTPTTAFVLIGMVITIVSEQLAPRLLGRWTYSELMSVLLVLGVGLVPVIQWLVLPLALVWLVRRQLAGAGNQG